MLLIKSTKEASVILSELSSPMLRIIELEKSKSTLLFNILLAMSMSFILNPKSILIIPLKLILSILSFFFSYELSLEIILRESLL